MESSDFIIFSQEYEVIYGYSTLNCRYSYQTPIFR